VPSSSAPISREYPATSAARIAARPGPGSRRFAGSQAQARQQQLAVLGVPHRSGVRYHHGGNDAQPRDELLCLVEPTHMGVAGGEKAIWDRVAWIFLDREKEVRNCLIETPSVETRDAYVAQRRPGD
jgi:hypothetical protein